jgi:hypothetical protein
MPLPRPLLLSRAASFGVATLLAACAALPPVPDEAALDAEDRACIAFVARFDDEVRRAGVGDAGAARIGGFATLRVDRFLASHAADPLDAPRFGAWVDAMRALDRDARAAEYANLPVAARAGLDAGLRAAEPARGPASPVAEIDACAGRVLAAQLATPHGRARLIANARVPDDYNDVARALGAYPLTGFAFAAGVRLYENEARAAYARGLDARGAPVVHWAPADGGSATAAGLGTIVTTAMASDALPPRIEPAARDALLAAYAPYFAIATATTDDRPGHPRPPERGSEPGSNHVPGVDAGRPVVFARIAWTRFEGALLPQLVYTIWFDARTAAFAGDPLAGRLDALVWRVTLDRDGAPLAFDTIHACGCYHQFLPTARLRAKPREPGVEEGAFVLATLPALDAGTRMRLDVEAGTHQLRGVRVVDPATADASRYALLPESALLVLARPDGSTASLYGPDGFVRGSERTERYAFWPTGIENAGAMRQWGRHATAFVGRRHFDEAFLLERYFVRVAPAQ